MNLKVKETFCSAFRMFSHDQVQVTSVANLGNLSDIGTWGTVVGWTQKVSETG
jgi:hypothetical protein